MSTLKPFLACLVFFLAGLFAADQYVTSSCAHTGLFQSGGRLYSCHVITCIHCLIKDPTP